MFDYLGYIAGFLVTFSLVPQILRIWRLKSAREISVLFTGSMLLGVLVWLAYGIALGLVPLIVWNSIGACFNVLLLIGKFRYGR